LPLSRWSETDPSPTLSDRLGKSFWLQVLYCTDNSYNSQDEEDEEDDEEDGSSIEEEDHDRVHNDDHEHEHEDVDEDDVAAGANTEDAPAYTNLGAPVEVGPNGYAVSPKHPSSGSHANVRSRRRRSPRRTSQRHMLLMLLLPTLLEMMPLPSETCLDGNKRPQLESNLQLVRAFPTLSPVLAVWTKPPISVKFLTLPLPPTKPLRPAACFPDSPRH